MDHEGFGMGQGDCTNFLLIARSLAQLETNSCPSSYYERISGLSACIQSLRLSFSLISFLLYSPIRMAITQVGQLRVRALIRPQRMSLFNLHTESSLNIRVARANPSNIAHTAASGGVAAFLVSAVIAHSHCETCAKEKGCGVDGVGR